jgi:fatty acid desaturase
MCRSSNPNNSNPSNVGKTASPPTGGAEELATDETWIKTFDVNAFARDIRDLGERLRAQQGDADVQHLHKMVRWSNLCAAVGFLTMGYVVNPVAVVALSTWTFSRWTMIGTYLLSESVVLSLPLVVVVLITGTLCLDNIPLFRVLTLPGLPSLFPTTAHHVCHGGYDSIHPNKKRWNRFKFAIGSFWNRLCDWLDWMMPEAWNVEHNNRHHYKLSEIDDPDLVENNLVDLRQAPIPLAAKYLVVGLAMASWKWFYYAPNTYKELKLAQWRKQGKPLPPNVNPADAVTIRSVLQGDNPFYSAAELFGVVLGPYLVIHFFLLPLPYLALGYYLALADPAALYWTAVTNLVLAEVLTNIHGFVAVVTNHAGDDMYRFRNGCRPFSGSFFLRQVLASVDFQMGTDLVDFLHGFLNYQIEHHLWPNLSMLSYQKSAPLVRAVCARHGVPYVQENVFRRVHKTVQIMVGTTSMKWFPAKYEDAYLEQDAKFLSEEMAK